MTCPSCGEMRAILGMPDVGVDLALNVFKLVQLFYGVLAIPDHNVTDFLKGCGIAEAQR